MPFLNQIIAFVTGDATLGTIHFIFFDNILGKIRVSKGLASKPGKIKPALLNSTRSDIRAELFQPGQPGTNKNAAGYLFFYLPGLVLIKGCLIEAFRFYFLCPEST
jgi:hypothetical protein